jgi:hypothetical protein
MDTMNRVMPRPDPAGITDLTREQASVATPRESRLFPLVDLLAESFIISFVMSLDVANDNRAPLTED